MRLYTDPRAASDAQFMDGGVLVELPQVNGHAQLALLDESEADRPENHRYEVINLDDDESAGTYATEAEARGCVEFDRLQHWQLWRGHMGDCGDFIGEELIDGNDPLVAC